VLAGAGGRWYHQHCGMRILQSPQRRKVRKGFEKQETTVTVHYKFIVFLCALCVSAVRNKFEFGLYYSDYVLLREDRP
jgi:hypothetical protein